jgi:hypothetical protein
MRPARKAWIYLSLFASVAAVGGASAQPEQPAQAGQPGDQAVEVAAQRDVSLTPQQMLAEANKYLPAMEQGAAAVRRQLTKAREERDVVKTLCLDDKRTQIDVAIRSAEDRMVSLRSAVAASDNDRAKHEFTVLQVLRDRLRTLVSEANQCIGEEVGFVGDSRVTVDIDPNIPETDPSVFPDAPVIISQPPVVSSPIQ